MAVRQDILWQVTKRNQDKANGVKHTPLHTLQECCEEAGIYPGVFGRWAAKYPGAPQPVINSPKNVGRGAVKYYRKHEFVQWVNQVRQQQSQSKQKEKVMPDLKSELSKVINAWEQPVQEPEPMPDTTPSQKPYFTTTNNVCRATFEAILKNPGRSRKQVIEALLEGGYKDTSTSTLIGQMLKQNHIREANGLLYAVNTEYKPLKGSKAWAKIEAAKAAPRKHVELVSKATGKIINPRPVPAPVVVPVEKEWTPDDVIAPLNVHQALALFKALRNILVG